MKIKFRAETFKNIKYIFSSQIILLISGLAKALVIPMLISLTEFGYWQIYVFYSIYIGIFTLGYGDGLYLKYGGRDFNSLPLENIRTSNIPYIALLVSESILVIIYAVCNEDPIRKLIFIAIAVNIIFLGLTSIISLSLQATNMLKDYAFINAADKVLFLIGLIPLINNNFRTLEYLVTIDLASKIIIFTLLLLKYQGLYVGKIGSLRDGISDFYSSTKDGGALLLANLSGMLILGVGRIVIEYFGDVDSYAYYAFALSISNVVLISVTTLSVVIYPSLRRQNSENYIEYFNKTNRAYGIFMVVMLSGYFPCVVFIAEFATEYAETLQFLNLIFIINFLQGKMQLIINTYYKVLRRERTMLLANAICFLCVAIISLYGFITFKSIIVIAYAAILTMLILVYASEVYLRYCMTNEISIRFLAEILVMIVFNIITSTLDTLIAAITWFFLLAIITLINFSKILYFLRNIRDGV